MVIVETTIFTRQVQALLDNDEYRKLQTILVMRPDAGDLISGWFAKNTLGKRRSRKTRRCAGDILLGNKAGADLDVVDLFKERTR